MKSVESREQWHDLSARLTANGYRIYQMQYDTHSPEGFHTRFHSSGKPNFEIVTHNDLVHDAIVKHK